MPLFFDINELKTHIGGTINKSLQLQSILPFLDQALAEYVVGKIGMETVEELSAPNLTGAKKMAQGLMKSAVAWLGVYEYSTVGNVQFTEGGIQRTESDTMKSAFKYQEAGFRKTALKNGWLNIEQLLFFLLDKPTEFVKYHQSHEKTLNTCHFLNFTTDFAKAQCRVPERYTYEALLPYISDVETFCIVDFLGTKLSTILKAKQYKTAETDISEAEKQLITYLRKGIAEMTYHLATVGNLIEYSGNRVITRETNRDDDTDLTKNPSMEILSANYNQRRQWADRYFRLAEFVIRENADKFADWQGFVTDTEGVAETILSTTNNRLKSL
jgi:hypothetical protein